jgi:DNA-3-methyladenine glycosylase II
VTRPYRLDLTAALLRRFRTNAVDGVDSAGCYRRALAGPPDPIVVEVEQLSQESLAIGIFGKAHDRAGTVATVRRMLGTDVEVGPFLRAARRIAWFAPLARRMRGVHPPRYPTLWEACANAVVYQQVSLDAASAIMKRTVEALSPPMRHGGATLRAFPLPGAFAAADEAVLRSAGLSAGKIATLRRVAGALAAGELTELEIEQLPTVEAAAALGRLKGIGPWTAAIVLLRGLGRHDLFPENDSGAARSLVLVTEGKPVALEDVLEMLGSQRGMLYYHLLLARLAARGELPPS